MNKVLEAIDPKPLPTCLCKDDMASKALRKSAAHVIPTWESGGAGIYTRRFMKQKPLWTASTAIDPMPYPPALAGMTYLLRPAQPHTGMTCFLELATIQPPMSQPRCTCHSSREMCGGEESMCSGT